MAQYKRWTTLLNSFLEVPAIDPDDARRRKLLNIILAIAGGISLLNILATFAFMVTKIMPLQGAPIILLASFVSLIGMVSIYLINRYRSGPLASALFLGLLLLLIVLADEPVELVSGRSLYLFVLPIIVSSILLGARSTFILFALCTVELTVLSVLAGKSPAASIVPSTTLFFIALITWLSARSLENAITDLRAINLNLDKLVEQKTAELAATLAREIELAGRNKAILDSIGDGVVVFDADQVSILANPALSNIIETPMENLNGVSLSDFINARELSHAHRGTLKKMFEQPDTADSRLQVEWGEKTLTVSVASVRNSETEQPIGTVAVVHDITREVEVQKMKDAFVAVVSHELRTPLNAVMGYAEMLKEAIYGTINEKQAMITGRIMVNTQRLLAMVGDLLDEAQIKAGKLSLTNQIFKTSTLLEAMHATMDKMTADKGLYLTDELDPDMPETIIGDGRRLQQVLINLVNNSAKFTEEGGIHARILRMGQDHWCIEVRDTGIGIPSEEIPHIFESFRQVDRTAIRKHGGFGLGLAIVKQVVELMKGEITVNSELGKGSIFTIKLPLQ